MTSTKFDFTGQVAVVTGANGNLGRAVARAFAEAGARLVLVGRHRERVRQALPEMDHNDNSYLAPDTDLTDLSAIDLVIQEALAHFGRIDILANTVGGYRGGSRLQDTDDSVWDVMMNVNARVAFMISKAVIPVMLKAGHGKIIHTAARAGLDGLRRGGAYAASKSAVISLTDTLALELKTAGINVNCILPGTIDTPQNRQAMPKANHNLWVTPQAIARIFLFLASDDAAPLHGAHIPAYGLS